MARAVRVPRLLDLLIADDPGRIRALARDAAATPPERGR
jgi:hypothetical protein